MATRILWPSTKLASTVSLLATVALTQRRLTVNHFATPSRLSVALCLAATLALGGCHKKTIAAAPPPPPTPAPAPTAKITVTPPAVTAGQSATLSWSTANATQTTISGLGTVGTSGSRTVSPTSSEDYTLTAKGAGGTADSTARLTVNPAPPKPVAQNSLSDEQLFQQNMHDVYFNYDKYDLRSGDSGTAQQDATFLTKHPDFKVLIAGHCDERGSEEYNIALGQSRAESMEKALESNGVPAARLRITSYGKERPFCTDSNEQCWQQNRRDHLSLDR